MHFAFFSRTQAEVRLRILEGRRSRLEERLEAIRAAAARGRERLDLYTAELQRHGLDSVEREVRWLSELIETERSSGATTRHHPARHSPTRSLRPAAAQPPAPPDHPPHPT